MNRHRTARNIEAKVEEISRILIVDDDEMVVAVLEVLLRESGFLNVVSTPDPREVEALYEALRPDLVLLDLRLPHMTGMEVLRQLRDMSAGEAFFPVIILSGDLSPEVKRQALMEGAKDFLLKPFDGLEVVLRIRNLLEMRAVYQALQQENRVLAARVRERTEELERVHIEMLARLREAGQRTGRDSLLRILRMRSEGRD